MLLVGPVEHAKARTNRGRDNMPTKHIGGVGRDTGFVMLRTDQLRIGMRAQTPLGLLPVIACYYVGQRYNNGWYALRFKHRQGIINAETFAFTEWSIYKAF